MRVLHIVPAAFNYFDDIKKEAFALISSESKLGIETEVITLQYGDMDKTERSGLGAVVEKSHSYTGSTNLDEAFAKFKNFDIIHIHCPLLGAVKKILQNAAEQNKPVLCSYYRDVKIIDLYSFVVWFYNLIFLPKIFTQARMVIFKDSAKNIRGYSCLKDKSKVVFLDNIDMLDEQGLEGNMEVANKLSLLYNNLTIN